MDMISRIAQKPGSLNGSPPSLIGLVIVHRGQVHYPLAVARHPAREEVLVLLTAGHVIEPGEAFECVTVNVAPIGSQPEIDEFGVCASPDVSFEIGVVEPFTWTQLEDLLNASVLKCDS